MSLTAKWTNPERSASAIILLVFLASCGRSLTPPAYFGKNSVGESPNSRFPIRHIVIVVQEARTLGNIFTDWPGAYAPDVGMRKPGIITKLKSIKYADEAAMCELYGCMNLAYSGQQMDGFNENKFCPLGCTSFPKHRKLVDVLPYSYMDHTEIAPYRDMARQYVLADNMYMTSWSGDFSAHLDLISGSTMVDSHHAIVDVPTQRPWGCDAPPKTTVPLEHVGAGGVYPDGSMFPCITQYPSMADSMDASGVTWKYYISSRHGSDASGKLWNAFEAFKKVRYGPDWQNNIVSPPTTVLTDAASGTLPGVAWVIPKVAWSDHPSQKSDKGPSWVAAIVNSIGEGPDWDSTAIIVVWSDWGGWFDARPPFFPSHLKGTGLGFRVPCLIISPYAKRNHVAHKLYQFGSILRFIEESFDVPPLSKFGKGFLFTDSTSNSIDDAFNFKQAPRKFTPIAAKYPISYFESN